MKSAAVELPGCSRPAERRPGDRAFCLIWIAAALAGWTVALIALVAAPGIR